jgi:inositol phosphorylceramide mannosyltransferase catalytic subunit
LTVMLSTGPLFLSVMWKEYIRKGPSKGDEVSVLMPNWYSPSRYFNIFRFETDETRFFSSFGGSSWHRADVAFIFWVHSLSTMLTTG